MYVLIPNYNSIKQWDTLRFHTDIFLPNEFNALPLPSMEGLSIAEESHVNYITKLEWSKAGIAKHFRCALGVLTSNHTLCVYASEGSPGDVLSWKRVTVVNDCIKAYWESSDRHMSELLKRSRARIQGFAWSEGFQASSKRGPRQTFLAVSNDNHEILIVKIQSEYGSNQVRELLFIFEIIELTFLG